ncbi:MAG: hypothetical protein ABIA93_03340 [Candidatus Woesearchaeota archaeon]
MGEVKVTYETLYDLSRREKGSQELQKLDSAFFEDVSSYIAEKKALLGDQQGVFAQGKSAQTQIQNITKLVREIYEKREKKILYLAMDRVRTGSTIIDTSTLIAEERAFYEEAVKFLTSRRDAVLEKILSPPETTLPKPKKTDEPKETKKAITKLKFVEDVPKFLGGEKKVFGPFNTGDEVEIPDNIARILLEKGKAEKVS